MWQEVYHCMASMLPHTSCACSLARILGKKLWFLIVSPYISPCQSPAAYACGLDLLRCAYHRMHCTCGPLCDFNAVTLHGNEWQYLFNHASLMYTWSLIVFNDLGQFA